MLKERAMKRSRGDESYQTCHLPAEVMWEVGGWKLHWHVKMQRSAPMWENISVLNILQKKKKKKSVPTEKEKNPPLHEVLISTNTIRSLHKTRLYYTCLKYTVFICVLCQIPRWIFNFIHIHRQGHGGNIQTPALSFDVCTRRCIQHACRLLSRTC